MAVPIQRSQFSMLEQLICPLKRQLIFSPMFISLLLLNKKLLLPSESGAFIRPSSHLEGVKRQCCLRRRSQNLADCDVINQADFSVIFLKPKEKYYCETHEACL